MLTLEELKNIEAELRIIATDLYVIRVDNPETATTESEAEEIANNPTKHHLNQLELKALALADLIDSKY
tara:strand:- start:132 stop:338 length:207 start_codon:yes stop_codon:yes gene_type:complete